MGGGREVCVCVKVTSECVKGRSLCEGGWVRWTLNGCFDLRSWTTIHYQAQIK